MPFADEVIAAVEAQRARTRILAMVDTLKYLAKGGRVSALSAGVSELLQVKLLIELKDGVITPIDRVRTRGRGLERLLAEAHKTPTPLKLFSILTTSGEQSKDILATQQSLANMGPMRPEDSTLVTPIIGAHIGPLGIGVVMVSV